MVLRPFTGEALSKICSDERKKGGFMRLSSLFVQGNQSYIDGNGREMDSASLEQKLKNGMEEIASK